MPGAEVAKLGRAHAVGSPYAGGVPEPDDFFRFAAANARELVQLGHAATGELAAGERMAEAALVTVFRSWCRSQVHSDPMLAARRALAAASRNRRRFAAPKVRGALELREYRPTRDQDLRAGSGHLDDELLWETLDSLSAQQRLTVALRYAGDLTVTEVARVLRRPTAAVRRSQKRALIKLMLAADLDVAVAADEGGEPGGAADLEDRVRRALRSHVDVPFDVAPLLRRVVERTANLRQRPRRHLVLVGATGILVVGAFAALLWSLLGSAGPPRRDALPRPPLPPGSQLVGYRTIAAVVPVDWTLADLPCGRIVAAGTTYRNWAETGQCAAAGEAPSVTFADAPVNSPPLIAPPRRTGQVAGHVSMSTAVTRVDGVYRQIVFVFAADFMMTVRSPDRAVVEAVAASVRAVPDGYTIVPACERLPVRDAVAALSEAGLTPKIAFTSSLSIRYGEPPVTFQNRASGSVVREGTAVALTIPSF